MNHLFRKVIQAHSVFVSVLAVGALLTTSVAIADIVSGSFTTNTSSNVTITTLTLAQPSSTVQDDLLLANVSVNGGSLANITAPLGWTLIARTDNTIETSIASYWKVAGASDPATYTWTISPQTRAVGGITRYSGVDAANPIDVSAGNSGRGKIATTPSITTSSPNEEIIALFAMDAGSLNIEHFSTPAGMTEKYDVTNTRSGPSTAQDDAIQASAGASGVKSSNLPNGPQRNWVTQLIVLRPAADSTLLNGPVSYWKFDESSGVAYDTAVNHYDLTNNNTTAFSSGKINNASDFGSSNTTQYFNNTSRLGMTYNDHFTQNVWINVTTQPANNTAATLIQWSDNTTANTHGYNDIQLYKNAGAMQVYIGRNNVSVNEQYGVNYTFTPGTWYMLTYTWDGSNEYLYINGSSTPTVSGSSTSLGTSASNGSGTNFRVGGDTVNNRYFSGLTDEVGIWNRVLSQSEITTLYNGGAGLQYPFWK